MEDTDIRFRLAIAIFHERQHLARALAGLHAIGLTSAELCLAGTREAFDRLNATSLANRDSLLLAGPLQHLFPMRDCDVLATNVVFRPRADMPVASARSASHLLEILEGLESELRNGAIAIVVSASSSNALRDSSKILLRHSSHPIQTHEFLAYSLPMSAGQQ